MKKLLFIHPGFYPPSGGNAVAAWMLQALKDDYAITLLTWEPFDLVAVNRFYGTSLCSDDFAVQYAPLLIRMIARLDPDPWSIQPINYLSRICKRIGRNFDAIVSAHNEMDFGVPGIQYVHYPYLANHYRRYRGACPSSPWRRIVALARKEIAPWMVISDFSFERMKNNVSLVNSEWTGRKLKDSYGINSVRLYPPVTGTFPPVPWEDRENAFVCIGRLETGKRVESIIEIVANVRRTCPEVQLHIIGTRNLLKAERSYYRRLSGLIESNQSWINVHNNISRRDLEALVARQRYGIHAQYEEHFGIAPAEMVRAGCVTFVHNSGGQVEIVGGHPALVFDSNEHAVAQISSMLGDRERQQHLREYLATRQSLFSSERFVAELKRVVRHWRDGTLTEEHLPSAATAEKTDRSLLETSLTNAP